MVDVSDAPETEGVMIALLPTTTEWSTLEIPHLTLVYAGVKSDLKPAQFNEMAKDTAMLASLSNPLGLLVKSKERFGSAGEVDVFKLQPTTQLWAMRRAVEKWNASEHEFDPHVTIGPAGTFVEIVPRAIQFNQLLLAWGEERLNFALSYR